MYFKLMMLMCLARPFHSAYLALPCAESQFKPDGAMCLPSELSKQLRPGKSLMTISLQDFLITIAPFSGNSMSVFAIDKNIEEGLF